MNELEKGEILATFDGSNPQKKGLAHDVELSSVLSCQSSRGWKVISQEIR